MEDEGTEVPLSKGENVGAAAVPPQATAVKVTAVNSNTIASLLRQIQSAFIASSPYR
jgi:hypothetical protein